MKSSYSGGQNHEEKEKTGMGVREERTSDPAHPVHRVVGVQHDHDGI